ncbi:MAG: T9SS type A sorting domain-containing protein [Ignavibacteria bacterium]|nr:T9SS type A sorting domain-containing protein [Ignavibacteria bacterium]
MNPLLHLKFPSRFKFAVIFFLISVILLLVLSAVQTFAQVNVGATPYTTLKGAFDAINAGTHTGAITITITGSTTEIASASLDSSGNGTGSNYTSITIQPSGGAARTISASFAGYIINLNGADNVTIDGLNTGGNSLTISNSGTGIGGALKFINDATNNIITNCTLSSSETSTLNAVVFFSTGKISGNDNNTISNSTLSGAGSNLPSNCIQSVGTSTAIGNANITITGCNIQDYFKADSASYGINLGLGSDAWIITNNKFFQTGTRTYTVGNTHSAIIIFSGAGYTVTGNTIGYASSAGTGIYTMAGSSATRFVAINMNAGTMAAVNSVQGNTVAGISITTSAGANAYGVLCGIFLGAGNFNIGDVTPNTIGAASGTGSLSAILTSGQAAILGVYSGTTGTVLIQNNTFGAFSATGSTASSGGAVWGVAVGTTPASLNITGNTFGNSTAENMKAGTSGVTTGNSIGYGILYNVGTGAASNITITNNTFRNFSVYGNNSGTTLKGITVSATSLGGPAFLITNNSFANFTTNSTLAATGPNLALHGIQLGQGTSSIISGNTISNFNLASTGTGGYTVAGILISSGFNTKVANNVIYNLLNGSTSTTATTPGRAVGILVYSGTTSDTIVNNMISLGAGQSTNTAFVGIQLANGGSPDPVSNIFYNTIYISGTVGSGAQPSFCIARTGFNTLAKTAEVYIRNNICDNARTGGTGKHYAIANNYGAAASSSTGWSATACEYNVLNSADTSTIGWWSGDVGIGGWKTASGCDINSWSGVPVTYTNTSVGNLRFNMGITPTKLESRAIPVASVTTDIDGFARPKPGAVNGGAIAPDMGAGESDMVPIIPLPVELASFTSTVDGNNVVLNWSTVMEENNSGFDIERNSFGAGWKKVGYAEGHGNSNQINNYSFTERGMASGHYNYRLKQIDYNGNYKYYGLSNEVIIGIPSKYSLSQNYPNPFNPASVIAYQIPANGFVSLKVFDISGREVSSLVNEVKDAGYYSVTFDAKNLSSGTYFYKLSTDKFSAVKKMVVIK